MRKCECGVEIRVGERQGRPRRYCSARCRGRAFRRRRAADLPTELTSRARWVRHDERKRPLTGGGRLASVTDPTTWTTFADAQRSPAGVGMGIVLGEGLGAIDLDHCLDGGVLKPWAQEILDETRDRAVYVEVSRSGNGLHIFLPLEEGPGRKVRDGDVAIEVYSRARYIALGTPYRPPGRGDVVEEVAPMARELKPCGTIAAARRHRRRGEKVCEACLAAEKEHRSVAARAKRARLAAEAVPENLSQIEELRFLYAKIKGALSSAEPKEVATLVKQGDAILDRIAHLTDAKQPPGGEEPSGDEIAEFRRSRTRTPRAASV